MTCLHFRFPPSKMGVMMGTLANRQAGVKSFYIVLCVSKM